MDRCLVEEYLDDQKTLHILMNYIVPEVNVPVVENFKPLKGLIEEIKKGTIIKAEKVPSDLPQIFRGGMIEKDNTKSVIIVPLAFGNKVIGSLAFACYRRRRKWSDDIVRRIKLIGEIIASTILRMRSHETLAKETKNRQLLEKKYSSILKNASVGFMITDFSDFSIIDVNDEYCSMSGYSRDELLSKKIWEIDASGDTEKVLQDRKNMMDQKGVNHITIEISDNGIGFDVEEKNKLFEPLYSTKIYGVGLGLPIIRQIIEQHGWTIDITGELQRGASVIITIPHNEYKNNGACP